MSVATYSKAGNKAPAPAKLDKAIFGVEVKSHELLNAAYTAYLSNGRFNAAKTKTRGEVRGGGRKPWRQKGTGNARFGSRRNPIWTGGGVAFGPTGAENYGRKLNLKAKRLALRQALTLAAQADKIIVLEEAVLASGKTKDAANLLKKLNAQKRTLILVKSVDDKFRQAADNLGSVQLRPVHSLNVFDILNADHIVITKDALQHLTDWLDPAKASVQRDKNA